MKILVTGFKPFLGEKINPSEILALHLQNKFKNVDAEILPVEFSRSFLHLQNKLVTSSYNYIILLGQAAGRNKVSLEKIALNWVQTENADESGIKPATGHIQNGQDLAKMSSFPVDQVYASLKEKNLPVEISFSAGSFVCNDLYYRTISEFSELPIVFVHVPLIKEQLTEDQARPFLDLEVQKIVLENLISALP